MDNLKINNNIKLIKSWILENALDGILLTSEDSHHSEFSLDMYNLKSQLLGFDGSYGTIAFYRTQRKGDFQVAFWTDGRYHLEAAKLLESTGVELFKLGLPNVLKPEEYLPAILGKGASFFVDGATINEESYINWKTVLDENEVTLFTNPQSFTPFPKIAEIDHQYNPIYLMPEPFCSDHPLGRMEFLLEKAKLKENEAILLSHLDSIAWLLELRGDDFKYSPLFYSLFLLSNKQKVLYLKNEDISNEIQKFLTSLRIKVMPYPKKLAELYIPTAKNIFYHPKYTSHALVEQIEKVGVAAKQKSDFFDFFDEFQAIRDSKLISFISDASKIDAVALALLEKRIEAKLKSRGSISEIEISDLSHECRVEVFRDLKSQLHLPKEARYMGPSFEAIAAAGKNAAIVHYAPKEGTAAKLKWNQPLLLDCGGQYNFATTDITRVFYFPKDNEKDSTPPKDLIKAYTLVLKGHLALERMVFPEGTTGNQLDTIARQFLWNEGMDYLHGTGHGVGFFLSVHEGPHSISTKQMTQPLKVGMVITNEPGYYKEGKFGIRIENMLAVIRHPKQIGFLKFQNLTHAPYNELLIDFELITDEERFQIEAHK